MWQTIWCQTLTTPFTLTSNFQQWYIKQWKLVCFPTPVPLCLKVHSLEESLPNEVITIRGDHQQFYVAPSLNPIERAPVFHMNCSFSVTYYQMGKLILLAIQLVCQNNYIPCNFNYYERMIQVQHEPELLG